MGIGKGNLLWRVYQGIQGKERTRTRAYALGLALGLLLISLNGCLMPAHDHIWSSVNNSATYGYTSEKDIAVFQIDLIKCCTYWEEKLECRVIGWIEEC